MEWREKNKTQFQEAKRVLRQIKKTTDCWTGYFSVDLNEQVHTRCYHGTQIENNSDVFVLFDKLLHVPLYFM